MKVARPIVIRHASGKIRGTLDDVSDHGLAVLVGSMLATGTEVVVDIEHDSAKIQVAGCVLRVDPIDDPRWKHRIALELDVPREHLAQLLGADE